MPDILATGKYDGITKIETELLYKYFHDGVDGLEYNDYNHKPQKNKGDIPF